jgi:hypothetical protein
MKRFSSIQKEKIKKINEQELTLPQNTETKSEETSSETTKQEQPEPQTGESTPVKFFSKLFEARQMAHIFHLQVKSEMGSGWEHDALNDFYDGILEFADDLIEIYQGQYGIVEGYEIIDSSATGQMKSLEYLKQTVDYLRSERKSIKEEDTHLHNVIDEIVALFYKTIYKLTNLK